MLAHFLLAPVKVGNSLSFSSSPAKAGHSGLLLLFPFLRYKDLAWQDGTRTVILLFPDGPPILLPLLSVLETSLNSHCLYTFYHSLVAQASSKLPGVFCVFLIRKINK